MPEPDFFIIGAAKAGTTTMHGVLERHPELFMPREKEPEFLARDDRYAAGLDAYLRLFEDAAPGQIVGEASTIYSLSPLFPETAARMHRHFPAARLVYVMRDPTPRAYSYYAQIIKAWQNHTQRPEVNRSFEEFVLEDRRAGAAPRNEVISAANDHLPDIAELCLAGGDYVAQIEAYRKHFAPDRFLFLKFEDFLADQGATLNRITRFLGVSDMTDHVAPGAEEARNMARQHYDEMGEVQAVGALRRRLGPLWALRKLAPKALRDRLKPGVAAVAATGEAAHVPQPMEDETRALLNRRYAAQRPRLEALTGLDFSDWSSFR